jgi:hypothetical protein
MRSPNDARERALKLLASATDSNGFEQYAKIWMVLAVLTPSPFGKSVLRKRSRFSS